MSTEPNRNDTNPTPPTSESEGTPPESPSQETTQSPPLKRKPRWGRRIAVLMLLFILLIGGLVALAPWALSRPEARASILSFVNDAISGEVQVERLSLSWFDTLEVDGLKIVDIDNQEVISVKRVFLGSGLVGVARDPTRFAELRIDEPDVHLRMDEHNRPTLVAALSGKPAVSVQRSDAPDSVSSLPEIVGKLIISNGRVRVTPQAGPEQSYSDIQADVELQSLDAIRGTLSFATAGGSLTADANVDNLTENGQFNVCKASGKLKVSTKGECELGPLFAMLMPEQAITGLGTLAIDADFKPDASTATIDARVWNLNVADAANRNAAPLEMTCNGNLTLTGTNLDGNVKLSGTAGDANLRLVADTDQEMPAVSADDIMAALFGGQSIALPAFTLEADSRIDLAKVESALPGILEFQEGQSIRTGVIRLERLAVSGGASPAVEAVAQLTDASVTREGVESRIAPMHVDLNAKIDEKSGLNVEELGVDAGFGSINASGTAQSLQCTFAGDLAAAKRDLAPFVNLGDVDMAGSVNGTLAVARIDDQNAAIDSTISASQMQFRVGGKSFDLAQSKFSQKGQLVLANSAPVRYRADSLQIDLDQQVVLSGSGSYDVASQAFDADVTIDRGDLDFLAQRADMLGASDLKRFRGQLAGNVKVRGDNQQNIETTGRLAATQLTSDGEPVLRDKLDVTWKDVSYRDGGKKLQIALASLASQEATIDISDANVDLASGESASGTIKANADLQGVFAAIARLGNMEKPPALKGQLKLDGDITQSKGGIQFAAAGGITQLEIGEGAGAVREERVDVTLDAAIDTNQKRIRLGKNQLSSGLLNLELAGQIDQYDTDTIANLEGEYSTQWKAITKLIEELSPGTGKLVMIQGTSRSRFSLNGPLNKTSDAPPYRQANAAAAIAWDSANIVGVELSQAKVDVKLDKAEVVIAPTTIGAAQGRVNLASRYDLGSSTLRIPGRVATLDGVILTPELARELLSRINPVFYHVVSAEGNVDLTFNNLELPMSEAPAGGGGTGKLSLQNAKIEPGGFLGELIALGLATTTGEKIDVRLEGADFEVRDGRIHYENFAMIFPYEFDLRFRGSVGLNDSVDLVVSIPVRPELLQRLGVKGPVAQYAGALADSRIDIPIVGTREDPKLQLSKVATDALVKKAIGRAAGKGAGELLGGLPGLGAKPDGKKDDKGKKPDGKKGEGKDKKKKKGLGGIIPGIGG